MSKENKKPHKAPSPEPQGEPPPPDRTQVKRMMTPYGALISVLFVIFWLIPIAWVGSMYKDVRFLPIHIKQQQRIACLFTQEARSWKSYHIQIQTEDNPNEWVEMSEKGYFDMQIFGYRSRMHRMLGSAWRKHRGIERTRLIATYITDKYKLKNPDGPKILGIRFIRAQHSVEKLAKQKHVYRKEPLANIPPPYWQIFGEVRYDGRRAEFPTHQLNPRPDKKKTPASEVKKPTSPGPLQLPKLKQPLKIRAVPPLKRPELPPAAPSDAKGEKRAAPQSPKGE